VDKILGFMVKLEIFGKFANIFIISSLLSEEGIQLLWKAREKKN